MKKRTQVTDTNQGQKEWNDDFIQILRDEYSRIDSGINSIVSNENLARDCGAFIRKYIDQDFTRRIYSQRKERGTQHKNETEAAVSGLDVAEKLRRNRGDEATARAFAAAAGEFREELARSKEAFATKRLGRDQAQFILYTCRAHLNSRLKQPVTYKTLANLVTAGYQVNGKPSENPITEEIIRKNFSNLKKNSPVICKLIDDLFKKPPETKSL